MGNKPLIELDYERLSAGTGVSSALLSASAERLNEVHAALHQRVDSGELPFLSLHKDGGTVNEILAYASEVREHFDDCVVLGIGGSSLGGRALYRAFGGRGMRLHFPDNLDPVSFVDLLSGLDLRRTLFNAVSKSGGTLETMAQLLVVRERLKRELGNDAYRNHLVLTTDPEHGVLRRMAMQESIRAFSIPHGLGGRFSVLSPVGLLPAALAGIDIVALMEGAAWAVETTSTPNPHTNEALAAATFLHHLDVECGRPVLFTVAYSDALGPVGEWFQQLWAESLGKAGRGPIPVPAVGATCQHSQLQLWMDGPPNAVVAFLELEEFGCELTIPEPGPEYPELQWMSGHSMAHILRTEKKATEQALTDAGRPNMTWRIPELTPQVFGALMIQLQAMTAYAGGLYQINPFDQPGVEAGKVIAKRLLT